MTLKIQVTDAGRAALVNAQNTGTLPVTVAKIGVTDQAFVANAGLLALPGQIKQLDTFSGSAVAADTIHVTIRDFSADAYTLRGFGLFLADGTLFAVYGDGSGAVILEKSSQAAMLLATDVIFADIDAAAITFGDTNFLNPPATTEVQGVVELATDDETATGTDPLRAVTPKGLLAALNARFGAGAPSAFVKTLLTAATAAALRVLIEIKGAALYDTGAGKGLDADLLDGQHGAWYRDWANLQNVPGSFPPAAHNHDAGAITSGTLTVARGGTGAGTFNAGSYLVGNGVAAFASKTPAEVLVDIGAAPKVHSHEISAVNGLQNALDAKAPLSSAALTGTPTAPTPAPTDNSTRLSTTAFVKQAIADLINGSPGALDTLNELAAALGDDPNFATTITNALAGKGNLAGGNSWAGIQSYATRQIINIPDAQWAVLVNQADGVTSKGGLWKNATGLGLVNTAAGFKGLWAKDDGTFGCDGAFNPSGGYDYGSSLKLKDDRPLEPMPYGLAEIEQIQTYRGRYNLDYCADDRDRLFLIVEQLGQLIPEVEKKGAIDYRGERVSAAQFDQLWPVAIRAIQQLSSQVKALREQVDGLKAVA